MLLVKKKSRKGWVALGVALALVVILFALILSASAQTSSSDILISGLVQASPASPVTREPVRFDIDIGMYIFANLYLKEISFFEWNFGDGSVLRTRMLDTTFHSYTQPGAYTASLRVFTTTGTFVSTVTLNVREFFQPAVAEIVTLESAVMQFDLDGDGLLSDSEFFNMIDAWISNRISNVVFFAGVDIWVSNEPIASIAGESRTIGSTADSKPLAQQTSDGVTFSARGRKSAALAVQVYNASGALVFQHRSSGGKLNWNLSNATGRAVASGVYFYVLQTEDADGKLIRHYSRKIVIIR